jgi:hypothetical protein
VSVSIPDNPHIEKRRQKIQGKLIGNITLGWKSTRDYPAQELLR